MSEKAVLFVHALTGLHPGSGTALGVVDLPVQRGRHTGWPVIPGTSLKGVLRDACRNSAAQRYTDELDAQGRLSRTRRQVANEEDPDLVAAFGPGRVDQDTAHAGALRDGPTITLQFVGQIGQPMLRERGHVHAALSRW